MLRPVHCYVTSVSTAPAYLVRVQPQRSGHFVEHCLLCIRYVLKSRSSCFSSVILGTCDDVTLILPLQFPSTPSIIY